MIRCKLRRFALYFWKESDLQGGSPIQSWGNLETLELWSCWDDLATSNGALYRKWKPSNRANECWQAIILKKMRNEIMYQLHDSPMSGGHFSVEKTLAGIKQRFWWPSIKTSVEKHFANCDRCAARSTAGIKRKAELQTFSRHDAFRTMAADFLGPITLAKKSRARYLLVMGDLFTKYAVTVALQDMTAAAAANAIIDEWFMKFGAPDVIYTVQGTIFNSELMHDICRNFMAEKTGTTRIIPKEMGMSRDLLESLPTRCHNIVLKNHRSGMCTCLILLFCITPPLPNYWSDAVLHGFWGRSAILHRFVCPETPGRPETEIRRKFRGVKRTLI